MTDEWEDIAYGPSISSGGSDDGWEDIAIGAPLTQPKAAPLGGGETFAGGIGNLLNAMTFGFGDEAVSGVNAGIDALMGSNLSDAYDARLSQVRDLNSRYRQEHPVASIGTDIAAAVKMPLAPLIGKVASIPAKIGILAGEGAAYGGLNAFGSGEGGTGQRLQDLLKGAETGAVIAPALGAPLLGLQKLLGKISSKAPEVASALERKSIGARQGDYAKTANDLGIIDLPEGDLSTLTKTSIDDLIGNGVLGKSRNPTDLLRAAKEAESKVGYEIGNIIKSYDENIAAPVLPKFDGALEYLASGKVPADKVESYLSRLEKLDSAIQSEGKGSLSYLQQQKIAAGSQWDPHDSTLNGFNRAIYNDLQQTIEQVVPDIAPLNKEMQKFKIIKPILQRGLTADEAGDPVNKITQAIRTSGGGGVPIITGTVLGGVPGMAVGAGVASLQKYLASPSGKTKLAGAVKLAGDLATKVPEISPSIPKIVGALMEGDRSEKASVDQSSTETTKALKTPKQDYKSSFNSTLDKALTQAEKQIAMDKPKPVEIIEAKRTSSKVPSDSFIEKEEGGQKLAGYVPRVKGSGLTIGTGVDLGQHSEKDLEEMGVSDKTIYKVRKYLGKKDAIARAALKEKPLELTKEEADELDAAVHGDIYGTVEDKLKAKGVTLAKLPEEAQTVIKSIAINFGKNFDEKIPSIWKAITEKDWSKVQDLLVNTKWKQPELVARRKREADLLSRIV